MPDTSAAIAVHIPPSWTLLFFAALALTTALTAPALVAPMLVATPAYAQSTYDFSDLAAKVSPAVVNVAVTVNPAVAQDDDEPNMAERPQSPWPLTRAY